MKNDPARYQIDKCLAEIARAEEQREETVRDYLRHEHEAVTGVQLIKVFCFALTVIAVIVAFALGLQHGR